MDHIHRGLSFPLHPFFLAVLCAYGIQLHDMPPNSVQHIACYIVLCEFYLGIRPHWPLFKRIFRVEEQPGKDNPHQVGGCNLQVNPKTPYFSMGFVDSALGWRTRWFYAKDTLSGTDAPLVNLDSRVAQRASWKNLLTLEESAQTDEYITRIAELKQASLTGVQLSGIFLKRRVQPLQARAEPMWEYKGAADTLIRLQRIYNF